MRKYWIVIGILGFLLLAFGCSPSAEPPSLHSASKPIDFPACRTTSANFKYLEAEPFKGLINCLNGENGALQPFKDLIDSMEAADLASILDIFNQHFLNNEIRRNQTFDLIDKMHSKGQLSQMMKDIATLARNQFFQKLAPIIVNVMGEDSQELGGLKKGLITLISDGSWSRALGVLGDHLGGPYGQGLGLSFAANVSHPPGVKSISSDNVADYFSAVLLRSFGDGAFRKFIVALEDPSVYPSSLLRAISDQERIDLIRYVDYVTSEPSRFEHAVNLARISDNPVTCFTDGGHSRKIQNVFMMVGHELAKRKPGPETDRFFLQTLPLMLLGTQKSCTFPPGTEKAITDDMEYIRLGFGAGKNAMFRAMLSSSKTSDELALLKSSFFHDAEPLFREMSLKGSFIYLANLLAKDFNSADTQAMSRLMARMESGDHQSEEQIIKVLGTVFAPAHRNQFHELMAALAGAMGEPGSGIGDLFAVLARATNMSTANPVQETIADLLKDDPLMARVSPLLYKIFSDERFPKLIAFGGKLAESGQLEKIVEFLADVLKSGRSVGLPMTNYSSAGAIDPAVIGRRISVPAAASSDSYEVCRNLSGSLFDREGENLFLAFQCINADSTYPQLSKLAADLKNQNLLQDGADTLRVLMESSPHILGALDQIDKLKTSGELNTLAKLFAWSADAPYAIPFRFDPLLKDLFRHRFTPELFKILGRLIKLSLFNDGAQVAVDVFSARPRKIFQSQNNFRLTLQNPAGVRNQIATWNPSLNSGQIDALFSQTKENFETHNDMWTYFEGGYPKYTEKQWRAELVAALDGFLGDSDLRETLAALQKVVREEHLSEFLSGAIDKQRIIQRYLPDGKPIPHIVTRWDQLEEMIEDANFVYSLYGVVDMHLGVNFELAVVNATNYVRDMGFQRDLVNMGVGITNWDSQRSAHIHFLNMKANIDALMDIANDKTLRIFQILFGGLYKATPFGSRGKRDATVNHMAVLFHLNNIGFFKTTTMALASLKSSGRLETFIDSLFGLESLLGPEDVEPLGRALKGLIAKSKAGDSSELDLLLDKFEKAQENPVAYQEFKDTLFHLVPALYSLKIQPSGVVKAIGAVAQRPRAFGDLLQNIIDDGEAGQGTMLTVSANVLRLNKHALEAFRNIGGVFLVNNKDGTNGLESVAGVFSDVYQLHSSEISDIHRALIQFAKDPRVKATDVSALLKNGFAELRAQSGFGDLWGDIFLDPAGRQRLIRLGYGLASQGDFAEISHFLANLINSGGFDSAIHFIFDNLSPSSLTSRVWLDSVH